MQTKPIHKFVLGLALVMLTACGPATMRRTPPVPSPGHPVIQVPTPISPDDFHATLTAQAPTPTVHPMILSATQSATFLEGVNSICVADRQTFTGVPGSPQPVSELAGHVLENLGYQVETRPDAQACDASLNIELNYRPLSEKYAPTTGGKMMTCYTGANASGKATLAVAGRDSREYELIWTYGPISGAFVVIQSCPGPEGAPFGDAMRWAVLNGMTKILGKPVLVALLGDPQADLRSRAAWLLRGAELTGAEDLPQLGRLLKDPDADVRQSVVGLLGDMGGIAAETFPELAALLQDPDVYVRMAVVDALENVGSGRSELVRAMISALNDPEEIVWSRAVNVLDHLGPAAGEAVPDLLKLFEKNPNDSFTLAQALESITGLKLGFELEAWKAWWAEHGQKP